MKSTPKNSKCKECYKRAKAYGTLLFCEATGTCKNNIKGENKNECK